MDYLVLPPEINSARMYSGAGSGPLLTAAASWDALAAGLEEAVQQLQSLTSGLAEVWRGPTADMSTAAFTAYSMGLTDLSSRAAVTSAQIRSAASAYSAAFAATIPPPLITANRARLTALISTNFLGLNTASILATEAEYEQMWAQDVAAMVEYQAASQSSTQGLSSTQSNNLTPLAMALGYPAAALIGLASMGGSSGLSSLVGVVADGLGVVSDAVGTAVGAAMDAIGVAEGMNQPMAVFRQGNSINGLSVPPSWAEQINPTTTTTTPATSPIPPEGPEPVGFPAVSRAMNAKPGPLKPDKKYLNRPRMLPLPVN